MKKILTGTQMLACDKHTIDDLGVPSRELMERAARSCLTVLESGRFDLAHTAFLCGTGNNGGDGMAMASLLNEKGYRVRVILVGDPDKCTAESAYRLDKLKSAGIPITFDCDLAEITTVVDALFGAGLCRPLEGKYLDTVKTVNKSGIPVLAVDIPSGISSDTGKIMGEAIHAAATAAIQNLKRGHILYPGAEYCGDITTLDIGITDTPIPDTDALYALEDTDLANIHPRPAYSNKGTFGRVLVIGGACGMAGAPYFSALAAYRTGAGLCEIFTPEENRVILQTLLPESVMTAYTASDFSEKLTSALNRATAVVIGPGLGMSDLARKIVRQTFAECRSPLLVDADALNITADENLTLPANSIITPHLGEMSRLIGKSIPEIQADLIDTAANFARTHNVICVLKDARSIITDGNRTYVNLSGSSAMAKGGSGDVLTGIIAALLAVKMPPVESAAYGAFLHGRAGECAAEKLGIHAVLARDIADNIRR